MAHPGRPCWLRLIICQLAGEEAVFLKMVEAETPQVACPICQGAYFPDAPGTVAFTFHSDCGNGSAPRCPAPGPRSSVPLSPGPLGEAVHARMQAAHTLGRGSTPATRSGRHARRPLARRMRLTCVVHLPSLSRMMCRAHRICTECDARLSEKNEGSSLTACPWCLQPLRRVRQAVFPGQVVVVC